MVYSVSVTTPAGTTTPLLTRLPISRGVIRLWQIFFIRGAQRAHEIYIKRGSQHICPINPGGTIKGEQFTFTSGEHILINQEPFVLDIWTTNSDIFDHAVDIYVTILPLWTLYPYAPQWLDQMAEVDLAKVV